MHGTAMALQNPDYQVLSTFRRELRRFLAVSEALAQAQGIPPQQHQAILAIKGRTDGALSIGDLADALLIKPNSAVELAGRLVEAGLVDRATATDDRRRIMLSLTPRAQDILAALSEAHLQELRRLEPAMRDLLIRLQAAGHGGVE
jgi:DNA-binding MarR family transcriptional regulator